MEKADEVPVGLFCWGHEEKIGKIFFACMIHKSQIKFPCPNNTIEISLQQRKKVFSESFIVLI